MADRPIVRELRRMRVCGLCPRPTREAFDALQRACDRLGFEHPGHASWRNRLSDVIANAIAAESEQRAP
jgi:hypothetical protein